MIRPAALAFSLIALAGCSTTGTMNSIMQGWQGENIEDVVKQWGYPNAEQTFRGRTLYVWDDSTTGVIPSFGGSRTVASGRGALSPATNSASASASSTTGAFGIVGGPITTHCTRTLEVDEKGVVVNSSYRGDCCVMAVAGMCASWVNPRRAP